MEREQIMLCDSKGSHGRGENRKTWRSLAKIKRNLENEPLQLFKKEGTALYPLEAEAAAHLPRWLARRCCARWAAVR